MTFLSEVIEPASAHFTRPHLVALEPALRPAHFVFDAAECTLGRGSTCEVVAPFPWVSRVHAQIACVDGRFELRDCGSLNGTYVNGLRLEQAQVLSNHDVIGLGESGPHLSYVDRDTTTQQGGERLHYDERTMRFSLGGSGLQLTPNQFRLLRFMHRHRGQVCPRERCAEAVWGATYAPGMDASTLDRLVSTLRAALRRSEAESNLILTRPGLGYQLADSA
jgi:hypothetical protein